MSRLAIVSNRIWSAGRRRSAERWAGNRSCRRSAVGRWLGSDGVTSWERHPRRRTFLTPMACIRPLGAALRAAVNRAFYLASMQ
jgi:hypothetical protein